MTLSDRIVVMSRGRLEQYGTPYEIYHRPATEFVASFVGKPRMNLLTAQRTEPGRYRLADSRLAVAADAGELSRVRVGIRPEECDLQVADPASAHGTVRVVEPLGNVSDVTVDLGAALFTARIPGFTDLTVGTPVRVDAGHAGIHLFDPDTGRRVG